MLALNRVHHPGEGRGPIGQRGQLSETRRHFDLPNWAPAFAGVEEQLEKRPLPRPRKRPFCIMLAMGKAHVVGRGEPRRPGLGESCARLAQAARPLT